MLVDFYYSVLFSLVSFVFFFSFLSSFRLSFLKLDFAVPIPVLALFPNLGISFCASWLFYFVEIL